MKRIVYCVFSLAVVLWISISPRACSQQVSDKAPRLKLYVGEIIGEKDVVKSVRDHLVDSPLISSETFVESPDPCVGNIA